jgi:hypothetical protein
MSDNESPLQDPHNLLLHFLSEMDKFKAIVIIGIPKEDLPLVIGHSKVASHELLGALNAAFCIEQVNYQMSFIDAEDREDPDNT